MDNGTSVSSTVHFNNLRPMKNLMFLNAVFKIAINRTLG